LGTEQLALPKLVVITDWSLGSELLLERLDEALSLGPAVAVQHRHPEATGRAFFEEARLVADLAARRGNAFFVNGRLDVAQLLGAHLHLRADDPPAQDVRPHFQKNRWISRAVHSVDEVGAATGADFALVSPVFPTSSKPLGARTALGREGFSSLAARLACPAFALGGIDGERLSTLEAAGAAVIGTVLHSSNPRRAAAQLIDGIAAR
jgi:thiamine-phosphate pyrophosphorylase